LITQDELKTTAVFGRDTWPFIPSGTRPSDPNNEPIKLDRTETSQWEQYNFNILIERLKEFRQDLKLTSSWIFAAILSLGVNLIFVSLFSTPQGTNLPILAAGISLFIILTVMAIAYLPSDINVKVTWTPLGTNWLFQEKYSQQIVSSLQAIGSSSVIISVPSLFGESITPYAHLICLANLRDAINKNKLSFVRVTGVSPFGGGGMDPFFLLSINVRRKFSLSISKNLREKVEREAFVLIQSLGGAQNTDGVYAFDYSVASWQQRGVGFLTEFTGWNTSELQAHLINQIIKGQ
jgi:hypothetical protein